MRLRRTAVICTTVYISQLLHCIMLRCGHLIGLTKTNRQLDGLLPRNLYIVDHNRAWSQLYDPLHPTVRKAAIIIAVSSTTVEDELRRYKALRVSLASSTLLFYWKDQSEDYPILSWAARRLFSISASLAQSERYFSSVGRTYCNRCAISAVSFKS